MKVGAVTLLNKIRSYIEEAFSEAPNTRKVQELKDELYSNLAEKYQDQLSRGRTEQEAYSNVISGIGDLSKLVESVKLQSADMPTLEERKKHAFLKSFAIGLYILCAIPILIYQSEVGVIFTLVIVALATALLIYSNSMMSKYEKQEDTLVEEFKEWRLNSANSQRAYKSFKSAYWGIVVAIFLLYSFFFGHWGFSWIIFIIASAIENIIKGFVQLSGGFDEK